MARQWALPQCLPSIILLPLPLTAFVFVGTDRQAECKRCMVAVWKQLCLLLSLVVTIYNRWSCILCEECGNLWWQLLPNREHDRKSGMTRVTVCLSAVGQRVTGIHDHSISAGLRGCERLVDPSLLPRVPISWTAHKDVFLTATQLCVSYG